jgi:hypothetical protein
MRRGLALLAIVFGIGIAVLPFAMSLWSDASAGQRIVERFDSTLSGDGLHALVTNFNTVGAMSNQVFDQMVPQLGIDTAAHPAIAHAQQQIPAAVALVGPVNKQLVAVHADFESVSSLPGIFGLPLESIPWLLLGLGVALIALGVLALVRPGLWATAAIGAVGLAMVVLSLALSLPQKADAAVHVNKVGKVALSPVAAKAAIDTTQTIDALVNDLNASYAAQAKAYPAVKRVLERWPSIRPGAFALAAAQRASLKDREKLDNIPFRAFPWLIIGPGIVLAALGAIAVHQQAPRRVKAGS